MASASKPLNIGARALPVIPQAQAAALLRAPNLLDAYLLGSPSFLESLRSGTLNDRSVPHWPRGAEYADAILGECASIPQGRPLTRNVAQSLGRLMMAIPAGLTSIHHLFPYGAGLGALLLTGSSVLSLHAVTDPDPEKKSDARALSAYFGIVGGGALSLYSYLLNPETPHSSLMTVVMGGLLSWLGIYQRKSLENGDAEKEDRSDDFAALGTGITSALAGRHLFVTTGNFSWAILASTAVWGIGAFVAGGVKSFWQRWSPRTRALFAATQRIHEVLQDDRAIDRYFSIRPEKLERFLKYLPEELRVLRVAEEERIKRWPVSPVDTDDVAEQARILRETVVPFDRMSKRIPDWKGRLDQASSKEAVMALAHEIRAASDLRRNLN